MVKNNGEDPDQFQLILAYMKDTLYDSSGGKKHNFYCKWSHSISEAIKSLLATQFFQIACVWSLGGSGWRLGLSHGVTLMQTEGLKIIYADLGTVKAGPE